MASHAGVQAMTKARTPTVHPALALMRHEATGYMTHFITDLTVHDAAALERRPNDAFAWCLHTGATYLAFMGPDPRRQKFAAMFVGAYGADDTRFFFWNGAVLTRYRCAAALDAQIADYESELRDRKRRAWCADRGI